MAEILRPMSTGELMDRTLGLYRRNFGLFVGIASLGPASHLLFQLATINSASIRAGAGNRVNPFSLASLGFGIVAGFLVMLAGMAISHAATVKAVAAVHLGYPIRIREAYKSLKGKIWRVLGVFICMGLLAGVAALGASLLIVVLVVMLRFSAMNSPGRAGQIIAFVIGLATVLVIGIAAIVVWVRYAFAIPCCVVEDLGVLKSLKRSVALSKGSRFRLFLIYLVFVILAVALGATLGGLAGAVSTLIPNAPARLALIYLAGFIGGLLTGPLATIGIALAYYDERVRKEAFDLQLMMSSLDPPTSTVTVPAHP